MGNEMEAAAEAVRVQAAEIAGTLVALHATLRTALLEGEETREYRRQIDALKAQQAEFKARIEELRAQVEAREEAEVQAEAAEIAIALSARRLDRLAAIALPPVPERVA